MPFQPDFMKTTFESLALVAVLVSAASACDNASQQENPEIRLSVSTRSIIFDESAGAENAFTVTSNVPWRAEGNVRSLEFDPTEGNAGETEVTVTDINPGMTGTITVTTVRQNVTDDVREEKVSVTRAAEEPENYGWAEMPETKIQNADYKYVTHYTTTVESRKTVRNYSACYDIVRHNPVWVAYPCHFCYREGGNGWERTDPDPWHPDPLFKEYEQSIIYAANYDKWPWTSESADEYQYWSPLDNGPYFTRGHLLRSADRSGHDTEINRQTFYPTNIAPERLKHPLVHEELERLLSEVWTDDPDTQAREVTDTVYVVSGCYYEDDEYYVYDACHGDDRTPGKSKICYIPAAEYKVYLRSKSGKTGRPVQECPAEELMAIGFWLPQDLENTGQIKDEGWTWDWADFAMSVDEIESRIGGGFEFFPEVPDAVTASFNLADWGLQ